MARMWEEKESRKKLNRLCLPAGAALLVILLSLLAMLGVLSLPRLLPWLMERLGETQELAGASPARLLLECCRMWYLAILGTVGGIWLALGLCLVFLFRGIVRSVCWCVKHVRAMKYLEQEWVQENLDRLQELLEPDEVERLLGQQAVRDREPWEPPDEPPMETAGEAYRRITQELFARGFAGFILFIAAVPTAMMAGLPWLMMADTEVPALYTQVVEDIRRVDAGEPESFTVWLSPKVREVCLPGPWSESYPTPLARYGAISEETGGVWVHLYMPQVLGFALDPDALYDENQTVCWNREYARQYRVYYTANLHIVISAEPLPLAGPC